MHQSLRLAILCVAVFCCARPAYAAVCAPAKLVHIVTTDVTPGVQAGSFNAQPKSFYRIGSDRMRVEEAVDSVNGIHGVMVTAEPNIWMANLYDNTGKHIVDPGPTFYAKAPIFYGMPGFPAKFDDLEFGCEADFIAANSLTPARTEQIGGSRFDVYRVTSGTEAIEILEQSGTSTPAFARYYHQGTLVMTLHYDVYSTGLANDASLFVAPPGVRYSEVVPR
ncbi:MAG TPA: hypothetical protein VFO29_12810 [Candidatus Rubrimentiphilum sp.]|nr:hypothetical protein [Candidatus Rubrimentiphilum sp.]